MISGNRSASSTRRRESWLGVVLRQDSLTRGCRARAWRLRTFCSSVTAARRPRLTTRTHYPRLSFRGASHVCTFANRDEVCPRRRHSNYLSYCLHWRPANERICSESGHPAARHGALPAADHDRRQPVGAAGRLQTRHHSAWLDEVATFPGSSNKRRSHRCCSVRRLERAVVPP